MHVLEFLMNLSDLCIGQTVGLSIDEALDGSDLVSVNEIWVISIVVDRIKVSIKDLVIKVIVAPLVRALFHDSANYLEKVSAYIVLLTLKGLQIRGNQQVLLLLVQEVEELLVPDSSPSVLEEEVEFLKDVDQEDLSDVVLASEEHVLVLLVELSDGLSVDSLLDWVVWLWREEPVSVLLWLGHERLFISLDLAVVKEVLGLLKKLLVLLLESLKFVHGVVAHLLQFSLVLGIDLLLDVLPVLLSEWVLSLDLHSWAHEFSGWSDSLWSFSDDIVENSERSNSDGALIDVVDIVELGHGWLNLILNRELSWVINRCGIGWLFLLFVVLRHLLIVFWLNIWLLVNRLRLDILNWGGVDRLNRGDGLLINRLDRCYRLLIDWLLFLLIILWLNVWLFVDRLWGIHWGLNRSNRSFDDRSLDRGDWSLDWGDGDWPLNWSDWPLNWNDWSLNWSHWPLNWGRSNGGSDRCSWLNRGNSSRCWLGINWLLNRSGLNWGSGWCSLDWSSLNWGSW